MAAAALRLRSFRDLFFEDGTSEAVTAAGVVPMVGGGGCDDVIVAVVIRLVEGIMSVEIIFIKNNLDLIELLFNRIKLEIIHSISFTLNFTLRFNKTARSMEGEQQETSGSKTLPFFMMQFSEI